MKTGKSGFWMLETSGKLKPAVEAYIRGDQLTVRDVAIMRVYLRQWLELPLWADDNTGNLDRLRAAVDQIRTRADITHCIDAAVTLGMDPL